MADSFFGGFFSAKPSGTTIHESSSLRNSGGGGGTDFRPEFTEFLKSPPSTVNPCTIAIVKPMNNEMVRKSVPMSKEHYLTARKSLTDGATGCQFLQAENTHVLQSNGTGVVYNAGKMFHYGLSFFNKDK
jgi:hypothetical protein